MGDRKGTVLSEPTCGTEAVGIQHEGGRRLLQVMLWRTGFERSSVELFLGNRW